MGTDVLAHGKQSVAHARGEGMRNLAGRQIKWSLEGVGCEPKLKLFEKVFHYQISWKSLKHVSTSHLLSVTICRSYNSYHLKA